MKLSLQRKRARKEIGQTLKQHILAIAPVHKLMKNRRAINAVLSNIILIGAVIVVGFAVISWSQYQSSSYQRQYASDVNASIEQLQEKIVFEYVVKVDSTHLKVFLLNCGMRNVTINKVYVNNGAGTAIDLHPLGAESTTVPSLDVGEEAFFWVPFSGSSPYLVKIVTESGSTFVGSS
jgi:archaellum component FlaF (FlaF/FlaG flagellin family)